jgi:hypothetical protein
MCVLHGSEGLEVGHAELEEGTSENEEHVRILLELVSQGGGLSTLGDFLTEHEHLHICVERGEPTLLVPEFYPLVDIIGHGKASLEFDR